MAQKAKKSGEDRPSPDSGEAVRGGGGGRAIWTGSISFGLLQIPVSLHSAEQRSEEIHFRMLDRRDLSPIRYERRNASTGAEVAWKDIVKGFAYEPDNFVVLDADDLRKANVKATQTIDIQDFVPTGEIDPIFFQTPYYLVPQRRAGKAYVLLHDALVKKGAAAIATFVLRTREHLVALMPVGDAIMLEVLRFGHELKDGAEMTLPSAKEIPVASRELEMAEQLIDGMLTSFAPEKYKDRYHDDVMRIIEQKAKTGTAKAHNAKRRGEVATDVVDLLTLLKKSVATHGKGAAANDGERRRPSGPKKARSPRRKSGKAAA